MNSIQIPREVESIIEAERKRQAAEKRAATRQRNKQRKAMIASGREMDRAFVEKTFEHPEMQEWLRKYLVEERCTDDELERIGQGYIKSFRHLAFDIPGLARILFDPDKGGRWCAAHSHWDEWAENREPELSFRNDSSWRVSLEWALIEAENAFQVHQENMKIFEKRQAERAELIKQEETRRLAQEAREEKSYAEAVKEERDETEKLLAALRSDHAAVHLLKAFLAIRQERSMFEERISQMDDSLCSLEERWAERAAMLRRQAEDADRRAEEERSKAYELQDDLDVAAKKIKKLER